MFNSANRLVIGLAVLVAISCSTTASAADAATKPAAIDAGKLDIRIDRDGLTINGQKIPFPIDRANLVQLLGEPSRVVKLANEISVWDDLGLLAYGSKTVSEFAVAVGLEDFEFWPKKLYSGKLTLEGDPITAKTTIPQLQASRKDKTPIEDLLSTMYRISYDKARVYLNVSRDKKTDTYGPVTELTIDPKHD